MKVELTEKDIAFLKDLREVLEKHHVDIEAYSDENMESAWLHMNYYDSNNQADGGMERLPNNLDPREIDDMIKKKYDQDDLY